MRAGAAAPLHRLRDPFVVGGARFAAFRNPKQSWTGFISTDPGPGLRWVAISVRVRNLNMAGFDPRVLAFRIVDRTGVAFHPLPRVRGHTAAFGPRVIEIEYPDHGGRANFLAACRERGGSISITYRDRAVSTPGRPGYVDEAC